MRKIWFMISLVTLVVSNSNAQQSTKRILFEKITSAGCGGCAYGDFIVDSLVADNPDIIPVHIHWHNSTHPDVLFCEDGDTVWNEYIWASPSAMIDRILFPGQTYVSTTWIDGWQDKIDSRSQDPAYLAIDAVTTYNNQTRELEVDIQGEFYQGLNADIRINAYILENNVKGSGSGYDQANSFTNSPGHPMEGLGNPITDYIHQSVLRDMLGGPWGWSGAIPASNSVNDVFSHTFTTILDNAWDEANVEVVVLAQLFDADKQKREILNAAKLGLNDSTLTDIAIHQALPESLTLYPNPATDIVYLHLQWPPMPVADICVVDLVGKELLKHSKNNGWAGKTIDISFLDEGTYFLLATNTEGEPFGSTKLVVSR